MAEVAHTAWYRQGTISATTGSTKITGSNTKFLTAGINPGATFRVDSKPGYAYEVASVVSDTEIQLKTSWLGQSVSGATYSIDRNFQSSMNSTIAAGVTALLGKYEDYIDADTKTINGKSAYEVAVANGYTGTEAQWLASLKASAEDTEYRAKFDALFFHNAGAHNSIYRGKNLGIFSEGLSAAIRSGAFSGTYDGTLYDIYPGDYLTFSNIAYTYEDENEETQSATYSGTMRIADLDYFLRCGDTDLGTHHVVVVPDANMFSHCMNDTNTTEGGYVNSKMRTVGLKRAEAIFKACFGENHILSHREYLVNAVTDGKPSAGAWFDSLVELMDERMVYGSLIFDSGASDGATVPNRYSVANSQLSLFRHAKHLISNRQYYWLRNVVSAAYFAGVGSYGGANYDNASNVIGVRPAALIY